jgi:predicted kinase
MAQLRIDLWDTARRSAIERLQWSVAKPLLACGATVVIEWGLWARRERDELRDQARSMGAAVELCFLDAPVELLRQRVRERGVERWPGSAPITRDHLEQWDAELERPDAAEHALYDPPLARSTPAWQLSAAGPRSANVVPATHGGSDDACLEPHGQVVTHPGTWRRESWLGHPSTSNAI